jgi:hypothetical protein
VSPKPLAKPGEHLKEQMQKQRDAGGRLPYILGGTILLTATAASFPLIASWWIGGNLTSREEPLTAAQVRRGAFLNSGSRDGGRDPEWDFQKGQHKSKDQSGYAAVAAAEKEQKQKLPAQVYAGDPATMDKYEKDLEAFAKGEKRRTS